MPRPTSSSRLKAIGTTLKRPCTRANAFQDTRPPARGTGLASLARRQPEQAIRDLLQRLGYIDGVAIASSEAVQQRWLSMRQKSQQPGHREERHGGYS